MLVCAASLAHHGLLSSVHELTLRDVDLSPVAAQHMASLTSCVTSSLYIENISGYEMVSLLTNLKCEELVINDQILESEETQALVRSMESGVEKVGLEFGVTLDIEALTEYSGQGRCRGMELEVSTDTAARYSEELRTWAKSRNWRLEYDEDNVLLKIMTEEKFMNLTNNSDFPNFYFTPEEMEYWRTFF